MKRWLLSAGILLTAQDALANDRVLLQLFETLLENGTITREQYDRLVAALKAAPKEKAPPKAAAGSNVKVTLDSHGLRFKRHDGDFKFKIGGRLHADASYHSDDKIAGVVEASDGTEIRRARIQIDGTFYKDWHFKADYDFAGNKIGIKDLYLKYTGLKWASFAVGHLKQPYSLEVEMSSNDIPFIERAIETSALVFPVVDRAIGLRMELHGRHWFFAGGVYSDSVGGQNVNDEGWGTVGRLILTPVQTREAVVHWGFRGAFRQPDDNRRIRFRAETANKSSLFLVNTGRIRGISSVALAGGEMALVYGPFSLEGEYTHAFVNRQNGFRDLDFDGWHVQATWSLTGESRAASYKMKAGEFKRLKPAHHFSLSQGGLGAWELAARYAWLDLNDGDVRGGKEQIFTVGLNWYLNPNIRLMFDWSHVLDITHALGVDRVPGADAEADGLNIFQVRTQLAF